MEKLLLWVITAIALVPMLLISIVLLSGHGASLVAGYNTMKPSEQKKWNEKAMCRYTGCMLLLFTLFLAGAMLGIGYGNMALFWGLTAAGILEILAGVIYLNKSLRFKN